MAGLWCVNVGYGRRELADALREQALRLPYYHSFSSMATDTPALLAERLIALAPGRCRRCFFGNSGSDANDTQVKLVWHYNNLLGRPAKKKIISRRPRLPRRLGGVGEPDRVRSLHAGFDLPMPACCTSRAPYRLREALPGRERRRVRRAARRRARRADPRRGPRHGRRLHRRAGAGAPAA